MNGELSNDVSYLRIRFGLTSVALGLLIFTIGAKPNWYGLERTPVVGFIQIVVFLVGLALICLGGFVGLSALWGREQMFLAWAHRLSPRCLISVPGRLVAYSSVNL
jgi:hypothetical protein